MKRALAFLALACTAAHAVNFSGNEYLALYESNQVAAAYYTLGLLDGGATTEALLSLSSPFPASMTMRACAPKGVNLGQFVDVAVRALRDAPEYRHEEAAALLTMAFRKAWPCKKSGGLL